MFTTKAFVLPHLEMIMAGTGAGGFLGRWFIAVNDRMVLRDIDNLDHHTPNALRDLWRSYTDEFSMANGVTTTVYHFGFSFQTRLIHSYAYRSTNNFTSERLQYGLGVKPECKIPERFQLPQDVKSLMVEQRTIQDARPKEERIYIGGKITIHHLSQSGFQVYTLDQFDDYDVHKRAIYENYESIRNDTEQIGAERGERASQLD